MQTTDIRIEDELKTRVADAAARGSTDNFLRNSQAQRPGRRGGMASIELLPEALDGLRALVIGRSSRGYVAL